MLLTALTSFFVFSAITNSEMFLRPLKYLTTGITSSPATSAMVSYSLLFISGLTLLLAFFLAFLISTPDYCFWASYYLNFAVSQDINYNLYRLYKASGGIRTHGLRLTRAAHWLLCYRGVLITYLSAAKRASPE